MKKILLLIGIITAAILSSSCNKEEDEEKIKEVIVEKVVEPDSFSVSYYNLIYIHYLYERTWRVWELGEWDDIDLDRGYLEVEFNTKNMMQIYYCLSSSSRTLVVEKEFTCYIKKGSLFVDVNKGEIIYQSTYPNNGYYLNRVGGRSNVLVSIEAEK